jgi:hypothetical protein
MTAVREKRTKRDGLGDTTVFMPAATVLPSATREGVTAMRVCGGGWVRSAPTTYNHGVVVQHSHQVLECQDVLLASSQRHVVSTDGEMGGGEEGKKVKPAHAHTHESAPTAATPVAPSPTNESARGQTGRVRTSTSFPPSFR